jgi:Kelch motif
MMRHRAAQIAFGGIMLLLLVGLPLTQITDTGLERSLKDRLGLLPERPVNCWASAPSPGWSAAGHLPQQRDEPRGLGLDGAVYLVGGIDRIVDYGDPSDVPGVPERVEVESSDELLRLDPATGRYETLPPLPEALNHVGFVTYEGDLYVVGGHGQLLWGATPSRNFYRYSPETRSWTTLPPMQIARGAVAAGVVGDRLIVAGGMVRGAPLDTVEIYDFTTGEWSRGASLPEPREHTAGAVLDGRFYVIGGRNRVTDSLSTVERYDPERDRWEDVPGLPVASGGLEAVTFDGTIIAMGGGDDRKRFVTPAVQQFDPDTERWTELPRMRSPRHGFAAAVVGERIYTAGGSPCPLFNASDTVDVFEPRKVQSARR